MIEWPDRAADLCVLMIHGRRRRRPGRARLSASHPPTGVALPGPSYLLSAPWIPAGRKTAGSRPCTPLREASPSPTACGALIMLRTPCRASTARQSSPFMSRPLPLVDHMFTGARIVKVLQPVKPGLFPLAC